MATYNGYTVNELSYQSRDKQSLGLPHESPELVLPGPASHIRHSLVPENLASWHPLRDTPWVVCESLGNMNGTISKCSEGKRKTPVGRGCFTEELGLEQRERPRSAENTQPGHFWQENRCGPRPRGKNTSFCTLVCLCSLWPRRRSCYALCRQRHQDAPQGLLSTLCPLQKQTPKNKNKTQ